MNRNYEIIKVKKSNDFVGIKFGEMGVQIYIPQLLRINSTNSLMERKDIITFLISLSLAKSKIENQIQVGDYDSSNTYWPIKAYLWIINDYIENGIYFNCSKKIVNSLKGKIDWKRTMRRIPVVTQPNVVYTDVVSTYFSKNTDLISQIYRYCLFISSQRIGWLFRFNIKIEYNLNISIKEMINYIKMEKNNTFEDEKLIRYNYIIEILENVCRGENTVNLSAYGINNYFYVFEKMIDRFFENKINKKEYYPKGIWHFAKRNILASSLMPDTILLNKNKVYIIDAKMYQYAFEYDSNLLPGTQSIQKQITYGEYVSKKNNTPFVRNIFVLPSDDDSDEKIKYIAYATGDWREEKVYKDYDYILAYSIDMNYLLHSYNKKTTEDVNALIVSIENKLNEIKGTKQKFKCI